MLSSGNAVLLSRVLVPLLGLVVWGFFYLNARCAYRLPRGGERTASQLSLVFGSAGIVVLQVKLMGRVTPGGRLRQLFFQFCPD